MITIKIGGSVVDDLHPSAVSDIKNTAEKEGVILVHGGGKDVSRISKRMGKEPEFVTSPSGIRSRYTDAETMAIFTMVMAGHVNKNIVRILQRGGVNAMGLSGADAGIIRADRKKKLLITNDKGRKQVIDGGFTGKITTVNANMLRTLLDAGTVPVISPVALGEEYDLLNVDGDRAAAYVAGNTGANSILFVTNVDGLLMDGALVQRLSLEEARRIRPQIGAGMEKKVLAATEALGMGVKTALISNGMRENPISSAISQDGCTVIQD